MISSLFSTYLFVVFTPVFGSVKAEVKRVQQMMALLIILRLGSSSALETDLFLGIFQVPIAFTGSEDST